VDVNEFFVGRPEEKKPRNRGAAEMSKAYWVGLERRN